MKKLPIVLLFMVLLYTGTAFAHYPDIEGNWARDAIINLAEQNIFAGIYEGNFEPNSSVTREEIIDLAARGFNLTTAEKQTLYSWLDHLMPMVDPDAEENDFATRAELTAVVANLMGLTDQSIDVDNWAPTFEDIDREHPLFTAVELVNKLNVLPTYVMNRFEPQRAATRAETAALLNAALNLENIAGEVVEIHQPSNRIIVTTSDNQYRSLPVAEQTLVLGSGAAQNVDQITVGDQIQALYDTNGNVALVSVEQGASGSGLLQNLANLVKGLRNTANLQSLNLDSLVSEDTVQTLQEVLTPEQVAAIISGDWSKASDSFRTNLFGQLVELGLAPWEAEAVLSQNWQALGDMGMDRVAVLLSDYVGVSPEIFYAAFNQDWGKVYEYAQVEIAQRLLTALAL